MKMYTSKLHVIRINNNTKSDVNTLHLSYLLPMWKGKIYLNPSSRHELAQIYTSDIYKEFNMFVFY